MLSAAILIVAAALGFAGWLMTRFGGAAGGVMVAGAVGLAFLSGLLA